MSDTLIMEFSIKGGDFLNAGESSAVIKQYLKQLGLPQDFIRRVLVAAYEAELNVVSHAYEGKLEFFMDEEKVEIIVTDKGPGIPDISLAMKEGYSTASPQVREMGFGAGMGLPNIKRNSDDMKLETVVGQGTTLTMHFFLK